jgi:hypothetical protein
VNLWVKAITANIPRREVYLVTTFVALYRGKSLAECRLLALSAEPSVVKAFAKLLLRRKTQLSDEVVAALEAGRANALRLVCEEDGDNG